MNPVAWERKMKRGNWGAGISAFFIIVLASVLSNCGGGGHGFPPPIPAVSNINFSTNASSAVNWSIEINGTGFQGAPGSVTFTQTSPSVTATVTPTPADWTTTGIVVTVPVGNTGLGTAFAVPGTVSVTVTTTGGSSNAGTLNLVSPVPLNTSATTWATTTPLPTPSGVTGYSGLRAVAVPGATSSTAFIVVAGGYDGTNNSTQVLSNVLNSDGTVGASWTAIATNPLPSTRAHFGMVEADDGNSLVPVGSRFIYVIGGQQNASDLPGGTTTVYMASVNSTTGAVGTWTTLASSLPASVVGPAATLFNGHIYVAGGLDSSGNPSGAVYVAPVNSDGTLGSWTTTANAYPTPVSFATMFGFDENIYVLDGDTNTSTDPDEQKIDGTSTVDFAPAHFGILGAWTSTAGSAANREKHNTWHLYGQVIDPEGLYTGSPGTDEVEQTTVNSDGTLAAWSTIASANEPGANLYNAARIVSPLLHPTSTGVLAPRVLLLGGAAYTLATPGLPLSNAVYYNNAP
jgi:hypothetical protein